MFASAAFAQEIAATAAAQPSMIGSLLPLVLIFVVFYFLLIRPQQKKFREHQTMVDNLRRGDKVVTGGGIIGTVVKIDDADILQVEIADGVNVKVQKQTLTGLVNKSGAAAPAAASKPKASKRKSANDNAAKSANDN